MDPSTVRRIDAPDGQDGASLEPAKDYRQRGVDFVKVNLRDGLSRLQVAHEWAESSAVPEGLRKRIAELFIEGRRVSKEAEDVL